MVCQTVVYELASLLMWQCSLRKINCVTIRVSYVDMQLIYVMLLIHIHATYYFDMQHAFF